MPPVSCKCGQTFDADPGDAICPGCGEVHSVAAEKIRVPCPCGTRLTVAASAAGKRVKCPKCGELLAVPRTEAPAVPPAAAAPPAATPEGWRRYGRWALGLALLPLLLSVVLPDDDAQARLMRMVEKDPTLQAQIEKAKSEDELFAALPEERIEGALLAHGTWAHWLYAIVAAAAFWGFILLFYPLGRSTSRQLWTVGVFTGTIGILLLLGIQLVAAATAGTWVTGRGVVMILFYIVKFIGFSYRSALDPSNGFLLSMLGFTFGVGLCEELCKALPLLVHYRKKATLDVRGAVAWGLATGIGFGVSEGITYSSDFYNGVATGGIYVVRFVSCVALHAVWGASNALLLWRRQTEIQSIEAWFEWFAPVLKVLAISMVLHGLYDTLLKRELEVMALLAAVASFGWFFWLYERSVRDEAQMDPAAARAFGPAQA